MGLLTALLIALPAQAQVPRLISYQGSLVEGEFPVSDTLEIIFGLYPSEDGGQPLWTETHTVTPVKGRFSVLLGSVEGGIPNGLFANDELWLQLTVEDEPLPRLRLTSTAYALRAGTAQTAETAENVAAGTVDTQALADGAVTTAKLDVDAVTSVKITNGAVHEADLDNEAVTNPKIGDSAITSSKLSNGSVTGDKIADGVVVRSLNGLTDQVDIVGEGLVQVQTENDVITISLQGERDSPSLIQPSSRRWKENVEPLEQALALVERLEGVRFQWKESGREDIGLIAEEVAEVVPEVVAYENGQAQGVNYGHLVALLIEAIKTQQQQIETRQAEVDRLAERIARLERMMQSTSDR